jgi:type VI secretion system secreted protein VgrG
MRHPTADTSWFTFESPGETGFRVYAFSGVEEVHRPYAFEIELVHESHTLDFAALQPGPTTSTCTRST